MSNDCVCPECNFKFTMKKNLYAHLRSVHNYVQEKDPVQLGIAKTAKSELCDICGKTFANKGSLERHRKNVHKYVKEENDRSRQSRLKCPFDDTCTEHITSYDELRKHLTIQHEIKIELEEFQFESAIDFQHWKDKTQEKSLSNYTLDTSCKLLADKTKKEYYNCHRSYIYESKGKNIRTLKGAGTNKIGSACPSRMEVCFKEEGTVITVKYWKTHIGHTLDIGRVFLSQQTRAEIAGALKEGVKFGHILDTIRDSDQEDCQRTLLLERKDMHNIIRDFHITYKTKRHQEDAVSIKLWVEEMKTLEGDCPVLYYKEQGVEDDSEILGVDDFALIIITSFQVQQLLKFGNDKICIDGTHGTNSYDFQLYTLMIVDEFGSGCPVAFCFSNRSDEIIFNLFFRQIKSKIGIIHANVFMSDDAPAFYNAWSSIMGSVPNRLLCAWHVDRNWRINLSKVKGGNEKKALVYKTLRVLLQFTSVQDFNNGLHQVLIDLNEDSDTTSFAQYFKSNYAHRPQCWAYCYRLGLGINTNMYLESLHKVLKHVYLEGKKVKRLDKTVDAVIKIARDSIFKRIIKLAKGASNQKIQKIKQSHKSSQAITLDMVKTLDNENEWLVTSSCTSEEYIVVQLSEECSEPCLRCLECNICIHSFKCSCIDNVIKLNICKHIHACATLFCKSTKSNSIADQIQEISNNEISTILETNTALCRAQPSANSIIKKRAELIIGLCDTTSLTEEEHKSVLNQFDKIIKTMNKSKTISLETVEEINVQQNVEKQTRLFSTRKKTKKVSELKKPTRTEAINIVEGLRNQSEITENIHTGFDHTYTK